MTKNRLTREQAIEKFKEELSPSLSERTKHGIPIQSPIKSLLLMTMKTI